MKGDLILKISLCMIVRDEQKLIKRCLDNALPLVDEAIIVDTGSTDNTKSIIREYGNKIKLIEANWESDFSKARNIYLDNVTGDWILVLDADEKINCNRNELVNYISHTKAECFNIRLVNILDDNQEKLNSWAYCRLFRNNGYRYFRAVHEQLNVDRAKIQTLNEDICKMFHYGYLKEILESKNKTKRNLDILIKDYEKNPEDSFTCYHIGATYAASEEYRKALDFFRKSYELGLKYGFGGYYFELVKRLSEVIFLLEDYKLCVDFINEVLLDDKLKKFTDLYYIMGNAYYSLKDYKHSLEAFNKCLEIGDTKEFPSVLGRGSYHALLMMEKIYKKLNEKKLAADCYVKAYKYKNMLDDKDIKSKNKTEYNLDILIKDYEKNPEDPFICYSIGTIYAKNKEYRRTLDFFSKSYEFGLKYGFGDYYFELVKGLSEVIFLLKDYKLCVDFINQLLLDDKLKKFTDLYYIMGNAYYNLKDYKHSLEAFNKCLYIGDTKEFPSTLGRGSHHSLMMMGKIYKELNKKELAIEYYAEAYKYKDKLGSKEIEEIEDYTKKL
jgi:tetratricopeptide (TPR) repeat protein